MKALILSPVVYHKISNFVRNLICYYISATGYREKLFNNAIKLDFQINWLIWSILWHSHCLEHISIQFTVLKSSCYAPVRNQEDYPLYVMTMERQIYCNIYNLILCWLKQNLETGEPWKAPTKILEKEMFLLKSWSRLVWNCKINRHQDLS